MIVSTLTLLLNVPISAVSSGDKQLDYQMERYTKDLEVASSKRSQVVEKADKEFVTAKEKLLTTLISSYTDAIKRVTQSGDLESANRLFQEKKRLEAEKAGSEKKASGEDPATMAVAPAGTSTQVDALFGKWEADMTGWPKGSTRIFEFKPSKLATDTRTHVMTTGNSSYTNQYRMQVASDRILFNPTDNTSTTSKRYLEIKIPFNPNALVIHEVYESPTSSNRRQYKISRVR